MMVIVVLAFCFFFFKQKTAYEMRISDWSSDVCSSDLYLLHAPAKVVEQVDAGGQAEEAAAVGAAVIGNDRHMAAIEHRQQGLDRRLHVEPVELADHRDRKSVV